MVNKTIFFEYCKVRRQNFDILLLSFSDSCIHYSDVDDDVIVLDDDDPDYMPSASAPATSSRRRSGKKQTTPSKKAQVNN